MNRLLQWVRRYSAKFFYVFGIHCATHQIRLILISGLVITSLFYPALAIYSSSSPQPLSHFSSRLLDFLVAPDVNFSFNDDVRNVWSGHDVLRVREDSFARARCGMESTIRLERLLVRSKVIDEAGAINHPTLLATLELEKRLTDSLSSNRSSCLSSPSGECIVFSPLEFWFHDSEQLSSDADLLHTINTKENVTVMGLPVLPAMTLAGRDTSEHAGSFVDFSLFLAVTYLFHEDDCLSFSGHDAWLRTVDHELSRTADMTVKAQEPLLLALEYDPDLKKSSRFSVITLILYISYVMFFVYFSGSMRRLDTVHSRIGLCFTGLVEILVSTITSLSVCAIWGLRITMVPWGIFPIVIVFVGAENMFRLIEEVVQTRITLPVKERIGVGLSIAGTSNTLKVVSYNAILGVIGAFTTGAIRQFCVFAIVVLVAHWFLIHTFFVAVLSIDIQRLELDDLLRQDPTMVESPSVDNTKKKPGIAGPKTTTGIMTATIKGLLQGRITRNVSLLLMLAITATLYYATLPPASRTRHGDTLLTRDSFLRSKLDSAARSDAHAESWHIWKALNPDDDSLVHLRIEAPIIVTFKTEQGSPSPSSLGPTPRSFIRTLRPVLWLFKIMILPIGGTLGCLYAILLYLLKDADLLDAQRHRAGPGEHQAVSNTFEEEVTFRSLPRTCATDVGLLAVNADGNVIASISLDGDINIWLASKQAYITVDASDLLLRAASTSTTDASLSCVAVDSTGQYCAVGSGAGVVGLWEIRDSTALPLPHLYIDSSCSAVSQIEFILRSPSSKATKLQSMDSRGTKDRDLIVMVSYANGAVIQWSIGSTVVSNVSLGPGSAGCYIGAALISPSRTACPLVAFFMEDGSIEVLDPFNVCSESGLAIVLHAGNPSDPVIQAEACIIEINNASHVVFVTASRAGVVSLWDGTAQECIIVLNSTFEAITQMRIFSVPPKGCSQCGELPMCDFVLAFSMGHVVVVERAYLTRRCSCPLNQPFVSKTTSTSRDSNLGRRSRASSFVSSSGADSPLRMRSRVSSLSTDAPPLELLPAFPISAHGGHTRRNSERDSNRRTNDIGDRENPLKLGPLDALRNMPSMSDISPTTIWAHLRLVRLVEATCERGGWDVMGKRILGLRRKSRVREPVDRGGVNCRTKAPDVHAHGLSFSVLDRWEVWIFDPTRSDGVIQASPLSKLYIPPPEEKVGGDDVNNSVEDGTLKPKLIPRLPFTRLSPVLAESRFAFAGFGNTTGMLKFEASGS